MTDGLRWLTVIGVGLLVPFGLIWWGVKKGKLTDIHVSRRSERLVPLLVGLMALGGMLAGLLLLSASRPLVATLVAVIVSFALAILITQVAKYKISLHIDSAAGAVTVCCLLVSPVFLALSPLVSTPAYFWLFQLFDTVGKLLWFLLLSSARIRNQRASPSSNEKEEKEDDTPLAT